MGAAGQHVHGFAVRLRSRKCGDHRCVHHSDNEGTGYSPALALMTEMSSSMLGNIIPLRIVLLTYGIWMNCTAAFRPAPGWPLTGWGCGLPGAGSPCGCFAVITRWSRFRLERPRLREPANRLSALLLPLLIFLPPLLDAQMKIGSPPGSEIRCRRYSTSVLMFTPLAAAYALESAGGRWI